MKTEYKYSLQFLILCLMFLSYFMVNAVTPG